MSYHPKQPVEPVLSDPTYQDRDISLKFLGLFFVGCVVIVIGVYVAMICLFHSYNNTRKQTAKSHSNLASQRYIPDAGQGPTLQAWPTAELQHYLNVQERRLDTLKRNADGTLQIPIQEAMRLALEKGMFPVAEKAVAPGPPQESSKTEASAESKADEEKAHRKESDAKKSGVESDSELPGEKKGEEKAEEKKDEGAKL